MTSLLLVEDHPIVAKTLSRILGNCRSNLVPVEEL